MKIGLKLSKLAAIGLADLFVSLGPDVNNLAYDALQRS